MMPNSSLSNVIRIGPDGSIGSGTVSIGWLTGCLLFRVGHHVCIAVVTVPSEPTSAGPVRVAEEESTVPFTVAGVGHVDEVGCTPGRCSHRILSRKGTAVGALIHPMLQAGVRHSIIPFRQRASSGLPWRKRNRCPTPRGCEPSA